MTNPYSAPEAALKPELHEKKRKRGFWVWLLMVLYGAHTLIVVRILYVVYMTSDWMWRVPDLNKSVGPLVFFFALASLLVVVFLFRMSRWAVLPAVALPVLIGIHVDALEAEVLWLYFVPACVAAEVIFFLGLQKKLR